MLTANESGKGWGIKRFGVWVSVGWGVYGVLLFQAVKIS